MATGFQAMQQAVKNISSSKGGGGRRFNYFQLEDGESIVVRFLTDVDEIVTCDFYEYVKTRDKEGKEGQNRFIVAPDYYSDNPEQDPEDWVLKYGGKVKEYGATELTDPRPKERSVAIAVEREAVPIASKGGPPKYKYQDKIVEVPVKKRDADGKPTDEEETLLGRNFIIIAKDAKTFWGNIVGYASEFTTLVDRDYKIKREGKQLATNYPAIPLIGSEEEWEDIEEFRTKLKARYGYGTGTDVEGNTIEKDSENRLLYCPMTLAEWCEDQASEDRAKILLTGQPARQQAQERRNGSSNNGADEFHKDTTHNLDDADEAQAAPGPVRGDVSDLRARLESHK